MAILGGLLAALVYLAFFVPTPGGGAPADMPALPPVRVEVPQLDAALLAQADDTTRIARLQQEQAPLGHLLEQSLDVGPTVARAMGMPLQPLPIQELRDHPERHRGAWLWYKGRLEELYGPRPGHPVKGYSIYEAVLRTAEGDPVMVAFSLAPGSEIHKGGWVRAEGFFLKLRDAVTPQTLDRAPFLVGRELQQAYEDWGPVTEFDPTVYSGMFDGSMEGDRYVPGPDAYRGIDEDQDRPLWHLAAFAREQYPKLTKAQWREVPALSRIDQWEEIRQGRLAHGTPMRVLGTVARAPRITVAKTNPAGIEQWTELWVQVRDIGGKPVLVWFPKALDPVAYGTGLELRAYYHKRYLYETEKGIVLTPLFVAAELDRFVIETHPAVRDAGWIVLGLSALTILWLWRHSRRERRRWHDHEDEIAARRRRRREREQQMAGSTS